MWARTSREHGKRKLAYVRTRDLWTCPIHSTVGGHSVDWADLKAQNSCLPMSAQFLCSVCSPAGNLPMRECCPMGSGCGLVVFPSPPGLWCAAPGYCILLQIQPLSPRTLRPPTPSPAVSPRTAEAPCSSVVLLYCHPLSSSRGPP